MIIWINGPFGVGKTTVAKLLARRIAGASLFDPEEIGFMLRRVIPREWKTGDFQDLPLWRKLTVCALRGIVEHHPQPVIVPMTLVNAVYFNEVIGELRNSKVEVHHFSLLASKSTLRRRLVCRFAPPWSTVWAARQMNRCIAALERPEFSKQVNTENHSVAEVADEILEDLTIHTVPGARNLP